MSELKIKIVEHVNKKIEDRQNEKRAYWEVKYNYKRYVTQDLSMITSDLEVMMEEAELDGTENEMIIAPVWLTEKEFKNLPEFEGY